MSDDRNKEVTGTSKDTLEAEKESNRDIVDCSQANQVSEEPEGPKDQDLAEKAKPSKEGRKRPHQESREVLAKKLKKERKEPKEVDDFPMNVPFQIRNGVRYLEPYWSPYRSNAKGRWYGRKLVDVFQQEFLSVNPNYAKLACRLGRIFVNGVQMTDVDYVIKNNDHITHWGHRHEHPVLDVPIRTVADTPSLLVIDKPASLPVHACGQYAVHTVLGLLRQNHAITGLRVLHRLDRATSGLLLFAKNYETDREFKLDLKNGEWTKEYVCKVEGVFPEEEVICTQPIGILVISMGIQCVRPDGKSAHTVFRRMWTDGKTSVVRATITTGRTHQIRVHAQYLGHPIVDDQIYNRPVWGQTMGKGGDYGKSFEQLCQDVKDAHRASEWHEERNEQYEQMMEEMANREHLDPEPPSWGREERPAFDSICLNCNVVKKEVPMSHFRLYLHCLKYETSKWSFSTPMPEWAIEPKEEGGEGVKVKKAQEKNIEDTGNVPAIVAASSIVSSLD